MMGKGIHQFLREFVTLRILFFLAWHVFLLSLGIINRISTNEKTVDGKAAIRWEENRMAGYVIQRRLILRLP